MTASPVVADDLLAIYRELEAMHAWRGWHWWPDPDPFEVIVGAILVQNTSWTNVERALVKLSEAAALDPGAMAALSDAELEELVRPSGQYRQKAKKLRAFLATAAARGGLGSLLALDAEALRAACLATWGIGPETADCIVAYAARHPALVIDAYTIRLFTRLGLGPGETAAYDTWQRYFVQSIHDSRFTISDSKEPGPPGPSSRLPPPASLRDFYCRYHALVVMHCKHTCLKRAPRCGQCTLAPRCPGAVR